MMIKAVNITHSLQQQKNSRTNGNSDFNAVLNGARNTSEDTKAPEKKEITQPGPVKKEPKANNASEMKNLKDQTPIEEEDKIENDSKVEQELAALMELQLLLKKLEEENINPDEALAILGEIAGLLESISPELLKGELLKLQEALNASGVDLAFEEGTIKLDSIKEILPALIKQVNEKVSHLEESLSSGENFAAGTEEKTVATSYHATDGSKDVDVEQAPTLEGNEEVLFDQIDLNPKGKGKDVTITESAESAEELVSVEEVSELPLNRGDVSLNPAKFTQKLEATLVQTLPEVDAKALVQEVVNKVQILVQKGKSEMKIQLTPENLGTLHINISLDKGTMTAKMFAENQHIKEMIDANLNQLKIALGDKGLNITKLEVAVGHNQEDFNRSQYYPQRQRNKQLKIRRVNQANLVGTEASTFLEEGGSKNPYVVNSKFNGLA